MEIIKIFFENRTDGATDVSTFSAVTIRPLIALLRANVEILNVEKKFVFILKNEQNQSVVKFSVDSLGVVENIGVDENYD